MRRWLVAVRLRPDRGACLFRFSKKSLAQQFMGSLPGSVACAIAEEKQTAVRAIQTRMRR